MFRQFIDAQADPLSWGVLAIVFGLVFAILTSRYVLVAGAFYLAFWKLGRRRFAHKRIQAEFPERRRVRNEILYSLSTLTIFGLLGLHMHYLRVRGWTQNYKSIEEYGWGYFVLSIVLMILLHDAYFYWTHRLMHLKPVFKYVHRTHHESSNPSPWAAFAFHPFEAVVEIGVVYIIILSMPYHVGALFIFLLYMTVMNALGHLGYELYPAGFTRHWFGRWHNTSVHHNMHYRKVHCNYGLYFNWWDRWCGTNHPDYHQAFESVATRRGPASEELPQISLNRAQ